MKQLVALFPVLMVNWVSSVFCCKPNISYWRMWCKQSGVCVSWNSAHHCLYRWWTGQFNFQSCMKRKYNWIIHWSCCNDLCVFWGKFSFSFCPFSEDTMTSRNRSQSGSGGFWFRSTFCGSAPVPQSSESFGWRHRGICLRRVELASTESTVVVEFMVAVFMGFVALFFLKSQKYNRYKQHHSEFCSNPAETAICAVDKKVDSCLFSQKNRKWFTVKLSLSVHTVRTLFSFRACYGVLRFIMESGAKGCEVVVSGKLRGQRAKSMKFVDGLMIHSGDPVNYYVDTAVRHVLLRQGECSSTRDTAATLKKQLDSSCIWFCWY